MAPDKLEQELRRKLQQREIQPSQDSWSRLEEKLGKKKSRLKSHFWMTGVAAVFAGLIFMAGFYFRGPVILEKPVIVNVPAEEGIEKDVFSEKASAVAEEMLSEEAVASEVPLRQAKMEETNSAAPKKMIASEEKQPEIIQEEIPQEEQKILLPKNDVLSSSSSELASVTDEEIEALLSIARAELRDNSSVQINPDALLTEVEDELEQSFRDRVFDVIKEGISRAKTAVANSDF